METVMAGKYLRVIRAFFVSVAILLLLPTILFAQRPENTNPLTLENDTVRVAVERGSGAFSVTEKITDQRWQPDPWEHAAAILTLEGPGGQEERINLSESQQVNVQESGSGIISISFRNPVLEDGTVVSGGQVDVRLELDPERAILNAEVVDVTVPEGYTAEELRYPARAFSLETGKDRGAGVIPYWQGVIVPSYIFPMTGGRFCMWDDSQHGGSATGMLEFHSWQQGLTMPWFGTHTERSGVMGVLKENPPAQVAYNLNYNGQDRFRHKVSPYPAILSLSPVWQLEDEGEDRVIRYHFLPEGDHVEMAKRYRGVAKERGYFVSLREKRERNEEVDKLAGAHYIGIYGGYPHYVNLEGMAFSFEQLDGIVQDLHENLGVDRAFIHPWGTWENYVPKMWPINEELGGPDQLRQVVDRAKRYGYLYSNYHAYTPLLGHDPELDLSLAPEGPNGQPLFTGGRWSRVDPQKLTGLAKQVLPKELEVLNQNADVTDIAFTRSFKGGEGSGNKGYVELAEYIRSKGLVMGTERGGEQWVPYFEFFEGMTYYPRLGPIDLHSHWAPLFNLVYHDAVATYGKIQDSDNTNSFRGDFQVKTLRNMLHGTGSNIFFAPYQYPGVRPMIRMAEQALAPVHKATFYAELVDHEYLSPDFKLQRSRFSNDVEVVVNLGPVKQSLPDGTPVPGYGFRVTRADGKVRSGQFSTTLTFSNRLK